MLIKTLLNNRYRFKSFVYGQCHFDRHKEHIFVQIKPRQNTKPVCPHCGRLCIQYDRQKERLFEFIPVRGVRVFFRCRPRRVDCPEESVGL